MKVKVDCVLSKWFGVVERTIFRLALNGYTDVGEIGTVLSLFSDSVVANGIRKLVNSQILTINASSGQLGIAEPFAALLNVCLEETMDIDVRGDLASSIKGGGILIDSRSGAESRGLKVALLASIVPEVDMGLYTDSLDLVLTEADGGE